MASSHRYGNDMPSKRRALRAATSSSRSDVMRETREGLRPANPSASAAFSILRVERPRT